MLTNEDSTKKSALDELFENGLREIYWSEKHLATVLATMTNAATNDELKDSLQQHQQETLIHANRLEQAFDLLGLTPETKHSKGMQGIFDEGWQVIDETEEGTSQRDVALIIAAQKVEHFEIACYGSLITLAKTLKKDDIADMLAPTLDEEKITDQKLTDIAEAGINKEAANEDQPLVSSANTGISSQNEELETEISSDQSDDGRFTKETPAF